MERIIWFGGVEALIRSKFRMIGICTFIGLLTTCFLGGIFHLDSIRTEALNDIVTGWCLGWVVVSPFLVGAYTTLSPVQGRFGSRRLELLTLPLGRWAIPTSILVTSLITVVGFWLVGFIGFGIADNPFTVAANFLLGDKPSDIQLFHTHALSTFLFFYSVCFVSTGAHTASFSCLWVIPPLVVLSLANSMGFSNNSVHIFHSIILCVGVLYYAILPFILYARPRFYWTTGASKWGIHIFDVVLQFGAVGVMTCYALFGFGSSFFFFSFLTGLVSIFALWRRDSKSRSLMGHARIGNILAMGLLLALTVLGVYADHQLLEAATPEQKMTLCELKPSPNNRYLLITGQRKNSRYRRGRGRHLVNRAFLVDLKGEEAPVPFSARKAGIDFFCWSADGRFVVVQEWAIGRINGFGVNNSNFSSLSRAESMIFYLTKHWNPTEIFDTKSKQFLTVKRPPILAEGWEHPDELVYFNVTATGDAVYYSKEQGQVTLPRSKLSYKILRYIDGLAYLSKQADTQVYVFKDGQINPLKGKSWSRRRIVNSDKIEVQLSIPQNWSHNPIYSEKDPRNVSEIEFRNGESKFRCSATNSWVHYANSGFYLIDKEGVCFLDLKTKTKSVILKAPENEVIEYDRNYLFSRNVEFYSNDRLLGSLDLLNNKLIKNPVSEIDFTPQLFLSKNDYLYVDKEGEWVYCSGESRAKLYELGVKK